MDNYSDPIDKKKIRDQFHIIEWQRDFICWLFEEGTIDWMTLSEAEEQFKEWYAKQDDTIDK